MTQSPRVQQLLPSRSSNQPTNHLNLRQRGPADSLIHLKQRLKTASAAIEQRLTTAFVLPAPSGRNSRPRYSELR